MQKTIALILCLVLFGCHSQKPASKIVARDIFEATKYGELDRVKSLVQSDPKLVNATSPENQMWPLAFAAANNHVSIAEFLLDRGANIEQTGQYGTALHSAADRGHVAMVKLLIARGANVNSQANDWKMSPLYMAASRADSPESVEVLLSHQANVKLTDSSGRTPLHQVRNQQVALLLLRSGVDINAQDQNGSTWLHWAASARNVSADDRVKFMLSKGADPKLKDKSGRTAAQIAYQFEKPKFLFYILFYSIQPGMSRSTVQSLITNSFPKNSKNYVSCLPLSPSDHEGDDMRCSLKPYGTLNESIDVDYTNKTVVKVNLVPNQ